MTLVICVSTYNRNLSLIRCLKSINNLYVVPNIKIKIIVVDNSAKRDSFKSVKKLKKLFKYKIIQMHEKRRGIVYARNKCLNKVKKINPKFICFFDDDCTVDRFWLKNVFRVKKFTNADVITGPQLSIIKKSLKKLNLTNYPEFFEKTYQTNIKRVQWASTNNVFLEYNIIKKHSLKFDKFLNKIEFGEDQLFFSKLNSFGHKIYWCKNVKVFEYTDKYKLNLYWLTNRSFRMGVVGYYIDKSLYGRIMGFLINYLKCIYYFTQALSLVILFFRKKFLVQILNYSIRSFGRLVGPLIIENMSFFRK